MRIVVLYGGTSPEREVSLRSGESVGCALTEAGYDVVLHDIHSIPKFLEAWPTLGADGVFIALHGGWGEDGRIQAALEDHGIPYTGSNACACRLSMDKEITRVILAEAGISVPPGLALLPGEGDKLAEAIAAWGKIVIKPASGGSTVAVTITSDLAAAKAGLAKVWDIDDKAIVERFIPGRELTVTVFGDGENALALPAIDIRPISGFYDYGSKYTKGRTEYICPADLPDEIARRLAADACKAHNALGCKTYSRIDFRLDGNAPYMLEANTAPGMTGTSLVPKAAAAYGWSFPELLDKIVKDSIGS